MLYSNVNSSNTSETSSSPSMYKSQPPPIPQATVYIKDLPAKTIDDIELANRICHRINELYKIEPLHIQCNSKLDFGSIRVSNEGKQYLVNTAGSMPMDNRPGSPLIIFMDTIELVSYVVVGVADDKNIQNLPKPDEISSRWFEIFSKLKPRSCECVCIQFPNVYRLITSIDESYVPVIQSNFTINNHFAQAYLGADCCYFEDIPTSLNEQQLREAIAKTIALENISFGELYVEINKAANNACIITCGTARPWSTKSSIYLGQKLMSKKENLTCYLLIHSVPENYPTDLIINHDTFNKTATLYKRRGTNLILEISDKMIFDNCLKFGTLSMDDRVVFRITHYTAHNDPDECEINADTWYDSEMLQYKQPDIMQFVQNPKHEIFRYKWNSKSWLQQFKRLTTNDQISNRNLNARNAKGILFDVLRHHLRVTVMLNTIATIRNNKYMLHDSAVDLNLDKKLRTIVYNHESKLEIGAEMPSIDSLHKKTKVQVANEDCLVVYERLANEGKKPLLLNMANATSAGGGYRKGDGAQEENLFRRSDYCRSLDVGLDEFQDEPCERSLCTSLCDLDSSFDSQKMYPMNEFGAIYTSGLTVFRQSEQTGYEYMQKPVHNVCALAMAAYRRPSLDGDMLKSKYAVGMRKKIENLFSIAYHHKHDCLVLSALGCGAFQNPPDHVAKLFRSVIEQYAGFFQSIIFAIVDDHNTGNNLNPQGNFTPFQRELDGLNCELMLSFKQPNTKFGPYRLSSDGSLEKDICIFDLPPCDFAAICHDMFNRNHALKFSHPPLCIKSLNGTCQEKDIVHMTSLIHRKPCKHGAQCQSIRDPAHDQEFEHPPECPKGGDCQDITDDHEKTFRHKPTCQHSHKCGEYQKNVKDHCKQYRHCKQRCRYGGFCIYFLDKEHIEDYIHPFRTPCPSTPYHCSIYDKFGTEQKNGNLSNDTSWHCSNFAHVCRYGRDCTNQDSSHQKTSIHIPRILCPYGKECKKLIQEDHLNSFTHPNIRDIRILCTHGDICRDRIDFKHFARYRHAVILKDSGVVRYNNLNKKINFTQNQKESESRISIYAKSKAWNRLQSGRVLDEILDWIRTIQPVHRCKRDIFESILLQGHVMSRSYMEYLKDPEFVAFCIMEHSEIRKIKSSIPNTLVQNVKNYVTYLVAQHYMENKDRLHVNLESIFTQSPSTANMSTILSDKIRTEEVFLAQNLHNHMNLIRKKTMDIAKASLELSKTLAGCGYDKDKLLGTDKQVFSILGPHNGIYYGEVVIVFKRDILHHPDANFTTHAGTSFLSGKVNDHCPWLGSFSVNEQDQIDLFHKSKLNASVPGYEYTTALELIATTSHKFSSEKLGLEVNLDQILKHWLKTDSHSVIEAHLPQLIPLDYIEHIYMPKVTYDELKGNARHAVDDIFKNCMTIVDEKTDPDIKKDKYNKIVIDALDKRFRSKPEYNISRPIQGTVMTIQSSKFKEHYVLPLTISQAYEQYQIKHPAISTSRTVYIYWQVMNGDMMLTLSNQKIVSTEEQPKLKSLICYIAPKPMYNDSTYHEHPSYLNSGHPYQHFTFLERRTYAAKSTTFFAGCNTDDLMTFCLEINLTSGEIILSHAGPNSIYNHEKFSCTFPKKTLDLNYLEYIHVSSGGQTLPIRNLIVCFEKQHDLHATFDDKFEKQTNVSNKSPTNNVGHAASSSNTVDDNQSTKPPGFFDRAGNAVNQIGEKMNHVVDYVLGNHKSKLKPCPEGIHCLIQSFENGPDHNAKYSHPCRFADRCQNPEQHLTHEPHQVPDCPSDKNCANLTDPIHRSQFHHTGWPFFLIPCHSERCHNKTKAHLTRYSHGEKINEPGGAEQSEANSIDPPIQNVRNIPSSNKVDEQKKECYYGLNCRHLNRPDHYKEFSHSAVNQPVPRADRQPCRWNPDCHDRNPWHRATYWHPDT
ncbi:unnamed protein product [Rotaria socialis]|nr:unnamed protein product [Rotaria socialis]